MDGSNLQCHISIILTLLTMDSTMPGQAQEKTILLVDDEHEIVALCTQALYTAGGGV